MPRRKTTDVERKLMKEIAFNIKSQLNRLGWSQKDLAERSDLSTSVVSDYLHEKTLATPGSIQAIADAMGIPKGDLDPTFKPTQSTTIGALIDVPILTGNAKESIEGYEATPSRWLGDGDYFYFRAKGDDMTGARIFEGALLLIQKQERVEHGEIAAVLIDGSVHFKRIYRNGDQLILQSESLTRTYDPIYSPPTDIKVIGRVKKIVMEA